MNSYDSITSLISLAIFAVLIFFFAITLAIRYRKRKQENEELQLRFTQEKLRIQVEIQEETLKHVSRELHDNLGHIASLVKIHLNIIKADDPDFDTKIEDTKSLIRQLIGDLKKLSLRLNDNLVVENGLLYAISNELERLNKTGLFKGELIQSVDDNTIDSISTDKAIILYRIVQEVINNFIKHSKGTNLKTTILNIGKSIILEFQDNGIGFNAETVNEEGAGLKNIRYRTELINASLDIRSIIGSGTTITITIPYKQDDATSKAGNS